MLEEQMSQNLERGKDLRLRMQHQTIELLNLLPKGILQEAILRRDDNEQRIGEVHVWKQLN